MYLGSLWYGYALNSHHVYLAIPETRQLCTKKEKGVRALRGYFGPLLSQKLKIAFYQFLSIGLLEEQLKCIILAFILLLPLLW